MPRFAGYFVSVAAGLATSITMLVVGVSWPVCACVGATVAGLTALLMEAD